jgi:AraC-like DNA-binding protein
MPDRFVLTAPLAFDQIRAPLEDRPERLARTLDGDLDQVELRWDGDGHPPPFRCSHRQCGGLRLSTAALPAGRGLVGQRGPLLLIPLAGTLEVKAVASASDPGWRLTADQALFLPGGTWALRWPHLSVVTLRLVGSRAEVLSGSGDPCHWCGSDPLVRDLLNLLRHAMALLDHDLDPHGGSNGSRSCADLLLQALKMLLQLTGSELQPQPLLSGMGASQQVMEDLLLYIQANLHQRLRLQDLEMRSGYSRRSLQYAFQRRFGCSPMQWVKQERLLAARRDLEHPQPLDTVSLISERYGYSSLSCFSRDIHQAFGVCPSTLLRRGLRHPD